jgi:hypothetical protein
MSLVIGRRWEMIRSCSGGVGGKVCSTTVLKDEVWMGLKWL